MPQGCIFLIRYPQQHFLEIINTPPEAQPLLIILGVSETLKRLTTAQQQFHCLTTSKSATTHKEKQWVLPPGYTT